MEYKFTPLPASKFTLRVIFLSVPQIVVGMVVFLMVAGPLLLFLFSGNAILGKVGSSGQPALLVQVDRTTTFVINEITDKYNGFMNYTREFSPVYNHLLKNGRLQYAELKKKWSPQIMLNKLKKVTATRTVATDAFVTVFEKTEDWFGDATVLIKESIEQIVDIGKKDVFEMATNSKNILVTLKPILKNVIAVATSAVQALVPVFPVVEKPIQRVLSQISASPRDGKSDADAVFTTIIKASLTESVNGIEMFLQNLPAQTDSLMGSSVRIVRAVADNTENIIEFFTTVFEQRAILFTETAEIVIQTVPKIAPSLFKNVKKLFMEPFRGKIIGGVGRIFATLPDMMDDVQQTVIQWTKSDDFSGMMKSAVTGTMSSLATIAPRTVSSVKKQMPVLTNQVFSILSPIFKRVSLQNSPELKQFSTELLQNLARSKDALSGTLIGWMQTTEMKNIMASGFDVLSESIPALTGSLATLTNEQRPITKMTNHTLKMVGTQSRFSEGMSKIFGGLAGFGPFLVKHLEDAATENKDKVFDMVSSILTKPKNGIGFWFTMITQFISERPREFRKIIFAMGSNFIDMANPLGFAVGVLFDNLKNAMSGGGGTLLKDDIHVYKPGFGPKEFILSLIMAILQFIRAILLPIWEFINSALYLLVGNLPSKTTISALATTGIDGITTILMTIFVDILYIISQLIVWIFVLATKILQIGTGSFNAILDIIQTFIIALNGVVITFITEFIKFLSSPENQSVLANFITALFTFIINLLEQLVNLLTSQINGLASLFARLITTVIKATLTIMEKIGWTETLQKLVEAIFKVAKSIGWGKVLGIFGNLIRCFIGGILKSAVHMDPKILGIAQTVNAIGDLLGSIADGCDERTS